MLLGYCMSYYYSRYSFKGFDELRGPVKRWVKSNQVDLHGFDQDTVERFFRKLGYR